MISPVPFIFCLPILKNIPRPCLHLHIFLFHYSHLQFHHHSDHHQVKRSAVANDKHAKLNIFFRFAEVDKFLQDVKTEKKFETPFGTLN